ncbi:MAG TPA: riboflavin synthase [Verrucomicrobiae bacterium]|nr:riboflavin synthase [Verrucomicrobiae bacterium]
MFTGIIERLGKIESLARSNDGARLNISCVSAHENVSAPDYARELSIGASIAVNGCCLTMVERGDKSFSADLSRETLARTSFADAAVERIVNLELPLAAGARLGGHFVQGHVDGVGRVERMIPEGQNWWLAVRVPQALRRYVAEKGSLAVDGISLTVARWLEGIAEFAIIPHTYANTNLQQLTVGDAVNLECDILAKYVESLLKGGVHPVPERLTLEKLIKQGF